jgi:hypothetical protein
MDEKKALITVVKRPQAGATKTRLCPPFSLEEAAALYDCLMRDTLGLMRRVPGVQPVIAYAPPDARDYFRRLADNGFALVAQRGPDLGRRLLNVLARFLNRGYAKAVVMNSDGPTLPVDYLTRAFDALDGADVVLGPGHDGGYYLIGMKRPHADLFRDIAWSTAEVVRQTLVRIHRLGLTVHQLPQWYDVDVPADLERLQVEFRRHPRHPARHTRRFLVERRQEGVFLGRDDPHDCLV